MTAAASRPAADSAASQQAVPDIAEAEAAARAAWLTGPAPMRPVPACTAPARAR
jgi:hypothetical protein